MTALMLRRRCGRGNEAAFTLIEVIVAAAVIAIGVLGTMAAYFHMNRSSMAAQETTVASNAARAKMDELAGMTFTEVISTYQDKVVTFNVPGLIPSPAGSVSAVAVGTAPTVLEITVTIAWTGVTEPRTVSYQTRMCGH